jgi:Protein of unknown function (DUF3060)
MSVPDDPEARIRDLEQPHDATTGQYPGGSYGAQPTQPWPSEPPPPYQPTAAGSDRPRWLSNLLLGLGLLVIVGAVVAYLLFGRERTTPGTPVSDGRTTATSTPRALPSTPGNRPQATVPVIPWPPTAGGSEPTTAPPNGKVSVSGVDERRTVTCEGGDVDVSGVSNTVVITGHCGLVVVSGMENVVTIDSADRIEASGINNRVTFHSGVPEVNNSGIENTVEKG